MALIVDNPKRDLPGVVLLGHELVQRGMRPVLVPMNLQKGEVSALGVSAVLMNYLRSNNEQFVAGLLDAGVEVAVCDTEGGVFRDVRRLAVKMSKSDQVRDRIAAYCAWGEYMVDYLTSEGFYRPEQVVLTGSPRFDFYASRWRPVCREVNRIAVESERPIVLICGSFPFANSAFAAPGAGIERRIAATGLDRETVLAEYRADCEALDALVALANSLAASFPEIEFVYRPHPFERSETYEQVLDDRENLSLHSSGTVDGWLLRSDFVIVPSDCTIGIEAAMAGVPAVVATWLGSEEAASVVASARCVDSEEELVESMLLALEVRDDEQARAAFPPAAAKDVIANYFGSIDGDSHQRVADVVHRRFTAGVAPDRRKLRRLHYRIDADAIPRFDRWLLRLKELLHLPLHWSFRRFSVLDKLTWDDSTKAFSVADVSEILDGINAACPDRQPVRAEAVSLSAYGFDYRMGRSIRLSGDGPVTRQGPAGP